MPETDQSLRRRKERESETPSTQTTSPANERERETEREREREAERERERENEEEEYYEETIKCFPLLISLSVFFVVFCGISYSFTGSLTWSTWDHFSPSLSLSSLSFSSTPHISSSDIPQGGFELTLEELKVFDGTDVYKPIYLSIK